jgi:hypothetical protein
MITVSAYCRALPQGHYHLPQSLAEAFLGSSAQGSRNRQGVLLGFGAPHVSSLTNMTDFSHVCSHRSTERLPPGDYDMMECQHFDHSGWLERSHRQDKCLPSQATDGKGSVGWFLRYGNPVGKL